MASEGLWKSLQQLVALLYVDDRLMASPQLSRLKEALDFLTGLFDRVVVRTNVENMVSMVCQMIKTVEI